MLKPILIEIRYMTDNRGRDIMMEIEITGEMMDISDDRGREMIIFITEVTFNTTST